jgi:hypothetical protein
MPQNSKIDRKDYIESLILETPKIVQWNNPDLIRLIKPGTEHYNYITNSDGNHGYFWYLHKITNYVSGSVVELGNRRGCSTLAIYDALKKRQKFYSLDIFKDCRYVVPEVYEDSRVQIMNDFNSTDIDRIKKTFKPKSIGMLFCDTIHLYEQIKEEYDVWSPYLKDDAIIVVDDIRDDFSSSDLRTKWKFHEEWSGIKFDVTDTAHLSGFGIYLK